MSNATEARRDQMERVVIGRRETCELGYRIEQPRSVLRWEFVTVDHGIRFGLYLQGVKNKSLNAFYVVSLHLINSFRTEFSSIPIETVVLVNILGTHSEGE